MYNLLFLKKGSVLILCQEMLRGYMGSKPSVYRWVNKKLKSALVKTAHTARAYPSFCSMKGLVRNISSPFWMGCQTIAGLP